MDSARSLVALSILLLAAASLAEGGVLFSSLPRTLEVEAKVQSQTASPGFAKAGEDYLVVKWDLNASVLLQDPQVDMRYTTVKVKLCYAPMSQTDRGWRKTKDDLHKDKTCVKNIATQKYTSIGNSTVWKIAKDVPGATYFVRAYALDSEGAQVAYGQTTNKAKTTNLFAVVPISGRHASLDIAAAVFSLFSVGTLVAFLTAEAVQSRKIGRK